MSQSESLKVGGNDLDAEIVKFLREEHNVLLACAPQRRLSARWPVLCPERKM